MRTSGCHREMDCIWFLIIKKSSGKLIIVNKLSIRFFIIKTNVYYFLGLTLNEIAPLNFMYLYPLVDFVIVIGPE